MNIRVGLGSWADPEYVGLVAPSGTPPAQRLAAYAQVFEHVEVNSSYYTTPRPDVVRKWVKDTPADFSFTIKLHRAFSQSPEKTARESPLLGYTLAAVKPLVRAGKVANFLLVLPPTFSPDRHRLEELDTLVEKLKPQLLAVELRHRAWVTGTTRRQTLEFFRERGLVWVAVDMPRIVGSDIMPVVDEVTNGQLAYLRLHGRNKRWLAAKSAAERHLYAYNDRELRDVVTRIRKLGKKAKRVLVIANNHARDFAPRTALSLRKLLERRS
jgi:uncharacterized protein YecE (DUF72 family)